VAHGSYCDTVIHGRTEKVCIFHFSFYPPPGSSTVPPTKRLHGWGRRQRERKKNTQEQLAFFLCTHTVFNPMDVAVLLILLHTLSIGMCCMCSSCNLIFAIS